MKSGGKGKKTYEGPYNCPKVADTSMYYIANSAALKFIPLRQLNEELLREYFPEENKTVLYHR